MDVEFLDLAEYELDDAFKYYEQIHTGLGCRFVSELEKSVTSGFKSTSLANI